MAELGIMGGTRDFLPDRMIRREYVIDRLKQIFRKYGFEPLETPAIERWETLAGKYGEEGEKLIYQVINSGALAGFKPGERPEHALRYDLTVPLARVMGMYAGETIPDPGNPKKTVHRLPRPFKRYQVQPVWRGDRPGEGRFREFFQCDCDVVGSGSLLVEAELVALGVEAFKSLGFDDFTIKLNHRQILLGLIEWAGIDPEREATVLSSIDKLDKLTPAQVQAELGEKGLRSEQVERLFKVLTLSGDLSELLEQAEERLSATVAEGGLQELRTLLGYLEALQVDPRHYRVDLALARGLDYYTGTIYEVVTTAGVGSVGGGGRYDRLIDNLSGGKADLPACGISFGLDRLLEAMDKLDLLGQITRPTQILVLHFTDPAVTTTTLNLVRELRAGGICAEIGYYDAPFTPDGMRSQLGYANEKGIPYAAILGPDEVSQGVIALRDLRTRKQEKIPLAQALAEITSRLCP